MKIKDNYINLTISVLGIVLIITSLATLNIYNSTPIDVWFHPKALPLVSWIGIAFSSIALLLYVKGYVKGKFATLTVLILVFAVIFYTRGLHRFMYQNPVYVDTFGFMGETSYTVTTGHLGVGYSLETPGFEAVTAQLAIVTGLDLQFIFDYFPLLISFFISISVLYLAYLLTNKNFKIAIVSFLLFSAICYWTFDYNRQTYSLFLQFFVWTLFCLSVMVKRNKLLSVSLILSFTALVYSHPASSLSVIIGITAFLLLLYFCGKKENVGYSSRLLLVFVILWTLRYALSSSISVEFAVRAFITDLQKIVSGDLSSNAQFLTSGYTPQYFVVIIIRYCFTVFEALSGGIICLYFLIRKRKKLQMEKLLIMAMFLAGAVFNVHSVFSASWFERGFLYSVIPWSIMFGSFIVTHKKTRQAKASINNFVKQSFLILAAILVVITPFTLNATTPFMYPPTQDLTLTRFLIGTVNPISKVGFVGGLMEHHYYIVLLDRYDLYQDTRVLSTNIYMISLHRGETTSAELLEVTGSYDIIATNFRAYIKGAFVQFDPPLIETMGALRQQLLEESTNSSDTQLFNRIYVADNWHEIYCKVSK